MRQGVAKIDRDLAGRSDGDAVEDADLHGHIIRSIAEKGWSSILLFPVRNRFPFCGKACLSILSGDWEDKEGRKG